MQQEKGKGGGDAGSRPKKSGKKGSRRRSSRPDLPPVEDAIKPADAPAEKLVEPPAPAPVPEVEVAAPPAAEKPPPITRPPHFFFPTNSKLNRIRFYKTAMCFYHANGGCSYAARCDFAHSAEELRPKPKPNEWPPVEKYLPCPEMDARGRCSKRRNCPYLHRALYSTTDFDQDFLPPPLDPPNIPPLMPLFVPNGGGDYATPPSFSPPSDGFAMSPNFVQVGFPPSPGFATPPPDYRTLPAWSPPMGAYPPTPSYYVMYCAHVLPAGSPPTVLLPPEMNLTICASMTPPY